MQSSMAKEGQILVRPRLACMSLWMDIPFFFQLRGDMGCTIEARSTGTVRLTVLSRSLHLSRSLSKRNMVVEVQHV